MEKQIGIWLDSNEALVISPESGSLKQLVSGIDHLTVSTHRNAKEANSDTKLLRKKNKQVKDFCLSILSEVGIPNKLYLFGPSEMKHELEKVIREDTRYHSVDLLVETADSMTKNQLIAHVRKQFN